MPMPNTRKIFALDATCPLVTKVHREAEAHFRRGHQVILVGHAGHPEVVGTLGQLPKGSIILVQTPEDVEKLTGVDESNLAYVTQTTLSIDDTRQMVDALTRRFPQIIGPYKEDICYATTNRQEAVKRIAPIVDAMIVVGSSNSSNSQRLREVAERSGCKLARLVLRADDVDWDLVQEREIGRHHGRRLGAGSAGRGDHGRLRGAFRTRCRDRLDGGRERLLPAAARTAALERRQPPRRARSEEQTRRYDSGRRGTARALIYASLRRRMHLFGRIAGKPPDAFRRMQALILARSPHLHAVADEDHARRLFNAVGREAQLPIDQAADKGLIVHRDAIPAARDRRFRRRAARPSCVM